MPEPLIQSQTRPHAQKAFHRLHNISAIKCNCITIASSLSKLSISSWHRSPTKRSEYRDRVLWASLQTTTFETCWSATTCQHTLTEVATLKIEYPCDKTRFLTVHVSSFILCILVNAFSCAIVKLSQSEVLRALFYSIWAETATFLATYPC